MKVIRLMRAAAANKAVLKVSRCESDPPDARLAAAAHDIEERKPETDGRHVAEVAAS